MLETCTTKRHIRTHRNTNWSEKMPLYMYIFVERKRKPIFIAKWSIFWRNAAFSWTVKSNLTNYTSISHQDFSALGISFLAFLAFSLVKRQSRRWRTVFRCSKGAFSILNRKGDIENEWRQTPHSPQQLICIYLLYYCTSCLQLYMLMHRCHGSTPGWWWWWWWHLPCYKSEFCQVRTGIINSKRGTEKKIVVTVWI